MRNPDSCCGNCDFWQPLGEGVTPVGQCRLAPPSLHILPSAKPVNVMEALKHGADINMQTGVTVQPQVPHTQADFWCGEHSDFYPEKDFAGH